MAIPNPRPDIIRGLSDKEALFESTQEYINVGGLTLQFWLDELARRDQLNATRTMKHLTWAIAVMTTVMTAATVINVAVFIWG